MAICINPKTRTRLALILFDIHQKKASGFGGVMTDTSSTIAPTSSVHLDGICLVPELLYSWVKTWDLTNVYNPLKVGYYALAVDRGSAGPKLMLLICKDAFQ